MYLRDRDSIDYVHNGQRQRETSKLVTEPLRRVTRVGHVTCKRQRELSYLVLNGEGGGGEGVSRAALGTHSVWNDKGTYCILPKCYQRHAPVNVLIGGFDRRNKLTPWARHRVYFIANV